MIPVYYTLVVLVCVVGSATGVPRSAWAYLKVAVLVRGPWSLRPHSGGVGWRWATEMRL